MPLKPKYNDDEWETVDLQSRGNKTLRSWEQEPAVDDDEWKTVDLQTYGREGPAEGQVSGISGAFKGGIRQTAGMLRTAANVLTGDEADVRRLAQKAAGMPRTPAQTEFGAALQRRVVEGGDESVWQAVKNVAGAAYEEPVGALHEVVAQVPNSAVVVGSMYAGAKTGAIAGATAPFPGGTAAGAIVGGILGLLFGNTAIETGGIAQEQIEKGEYERGEVLGKGLKKGGVITGLDVVTMGASKFLFSAPVKAAEKAVSRVLIKNGLNPLDKMITAVAIETNEVLRRQIRKAATKAIVEATPKGFKSIGLHGTALTLDMLGEGTGEYLGSKAAGIDASLTDAAMEAMMSVPQSMAEVGVGKSLAGVKKTLKGFGKPEAVTARDVLLDEDEKNITAKALLMEEEPPSPEEAAGVKPLVTPLTKEELAEAEKVKAPTPLPAAEALTTEELTKKRAEVLEKIPKEPAEMAAEAFEREMTEDEKVRAAAEIEPDINKFLRRAKPEEISKPEQKDILKGMTIKQAQDAAKRWNDIWDAAKTKPTKDARLIEAEDLIKERPDLFDLVHGKLAVKPEAEIKPSAPPVTPKVEIPKPAETKLEADAEVKKWLAEKIEKEPAHKIEARGLFVARVRQFADLTDEQTQDLFLRDEFTEKIMPRIDAAFEKGAGNKEITDEARKVAVEVRKRLGKKPVELIKPAEAKPVAEVEKPEFKEPAKVKKIGIPTFTDTTQAVEFGKKATPEQITELKRLRKESEVKYAALTKEGKLDEANKEAFRAQLYREAFEAKEKPAKPLLPEAEKPAKEIVPEKIEEKKLYKMTLAEIHKEPDVLMSLELRQLHDHKARTVGFEKVGKSFVEGYLKKLAEVAGKTDMPVAMAAYEALSMYKKGNITQASLEAEKILGKLHKAEREILTPDKISEIHKKDIQKALKEGKSIPVEVLAEYPDLAIAKPPPKPSEAKPSEALKKEPVPKPAAEMTAEEMMAEWDKQVKETKPTPTAKEKAVETKEHLSKAADAFKAINAIFGEKGVIFEGVDETRWKQIKPLLKVAFDEIVAAGKSGAEFVSIALKSLSPKDKPYFERFVKEEMGKEAKREEKPGEAVSRPVRPEGEITPEGVSPKDVRKPEGKGEPSGISDKLGTEAQRADDESRKKRDEIRRGKRDHKGDTVSAERGRNAGIGNFRIRDDAGLEEGGIVAKYGRNIDAIKLLKEIEKENRQATAKEQEILSMYVGWGGMPNAFVTQRGEPAWIARAKELKEILTDEEYTSARRSTPNAHYTAPMAVKFMYNVLDRLGFKNGRMLEPAVGVGYFLGKTPQQWKNLQLSGIELDSISGRIAKQLYQKADIRIEGYEKAKLPNNYFDLIVSNVPFADYRPYDPVYKKYRFRLHDYYFAKSLDKVRPGGMIAFMTSTGTLDKKDCLLRKYIAERAELIAAFRLPSETHKKIANTEVTTDIIILRKLEAGEVADKTLEWIETGEVKYKDNNGYETASEINQYYINHPEMMLGEVVQDKLQYTRAALSLKGRDIDALMTEVLKKVPENVYKEAKEKVTPKEMTNELISAPEDIKEQTFYEKNGVFYQKVSGKAVRVPLPKNQVGRMQGLIGIRGELRNLFSDQLQGNDEKLKGNLERLNKAYDVFVKKYGNIHDNANGKLFKEDSEFPRLLALENWDKKTKTATKTDVFFKPTIATYKPVEKARDSEHALFASLFDKGGIDWKHMAVISGIPVELLQKNLYGKVFLNPEGGWETEDDYLSGQVKAKLVAAEGAMEAEVDPVRQIQYAQNVETLRKVIPEDVKTSNITAKLGASWIPPGVIKNFIADLVDEYGHTVRYVPETSSWKIDHGNSGYGFDSMKNLSKWGTSRKPAIELIRLALNMQQPVVYDYTTEDGKRKSVKNANETILAEQKQKQIKQRFMKWAWKDTNRRTEMARLFNDTYNNTRERRYDGSHLPDLFPGMAPGIIGKLRPHQKNAIWRILQGKNTLLDHVVGSGKTYSMITAAMELKRMGLVQKPIFVVPKSILPQWEGEFRKLYPAAKIFVADLSSKERAESMSRIAQGEWDSVLVTHPQFERLGMSRQAQSDFINEQIIDLETAAWREETANIEAGRKKKDRIVKELERMKLRLAAKLTELLDKTKDGALVFEELGVDYMFVDEAHKFKNLFFTSKMARIPGVGASKDVARSVDMFLKTQYMSRVNKKRGVVFATGTPISNSVSEMYTMSKYLAMDVLQNLGIERFDAWAGTFGDITSDVEIIPTGAGFRMHSRFKNFSNVPAMQSVYNTFADTIEQEDVKDQIIIPEHMSGKIQIVAAEPSEEQRQYVDSLVDRMEDIATGRVDPREDNPLKVTGDGMKCALDMRAVVSSASDNPTGKLALASQKIKEIYKNTEKDKSAQLIFLDRSIPQKGAWTAYQQLKDNLIEQGVRADEIEFIHSAGNNDAKRDALFKKVITGEIRVIIGSSEKMGVGVNFQDKLIAIHHIDAPWKPAEIEQRNGRIFRQGNENEKVWEFRYVTKETFDAYMWQTLETKAKFISQAKSKNTGYTVEGDVGNIVFSAAEVKALASGNPIVMEKVKVDAELRILEMQYNEWMDNKWVMQSKIDPEYPPSIPNEIKNIEESVKTLDATLKVIDEHPLKKDEFKITINGIEFTDAKEARKPLVEAITALTTEDYKEIAEYRGLKIEGALNIKAGAIIVEMHIGEISESIQLHRSNYYTSTDTAGVAYQNKIIKSIEGLSAGREQLNKQIATRKKEIETIEKELKQPFDKTKQLEATRERAKEIYGIMDRAQEEIEGAEPVEAEVAKFYVRMGTHAQPATPILLTTEFSPMILTTEQTGQPWANTLFVHKAREFKEEKPVEGWVVTEQRTGVKVSTGNTRKEAIETARFRLSEITEKDFEKMLTVFLEKYGTMPGVKEKQFAAKTIRPQDTITRKDLESMFAPMKNIRTGVNAKGNLYFGVEGRPSVEIFEVDHVAGYINTSAGQIPVGSYLGNTIELKTGGPGHTADISTAFHEFTHWMENNGILSNNDVKALDKAIGKDIVTAEDRANYVGDRLAVWQSEKNSRIKRILKKIADFVNAVWEMVSKTRTARGVLADIERGKLLKKPRVSVPAIKTTVPAFQQTAERFYSQVVKTVQDKMPAKMQASAVMNWLRKQPGIKAAELEWMDAEAMLEGKKVVGRDELVGLLKENEVRIEEVEKGELKKFPTDKEISEASEKVAMLNQRIIFDLEAGTPAHEQAVRDLAEAESIVTSGVHGEIGIEPKFSQYQLPGEKENYRELLFMLPHKPQRSESLSEWLKRIHNISDITKLLPEKRVELRKEYLTKRNAGELVTKDISFRSTHWDEPNVFSHVRLNERIDSDQNHILFVEEIQSDWEQAIRKGKKVPDMPFKKNYQEVVLKRIIRMAAEQGIDKISWITGKQTADRYDLSKHISELAYWKDDKAKTGESTWGVSLLDREGKTIDGWNPNEMLTASELESNLGKNVTKKIINDQGNATPEDSEYSDKKTGKLAKGISVIQEEGLKIGGEWCYRLYGDSEAVIKKEFPNNTDMLKYAYEGKNAAIIPAYLRKFGKKYKSEVGTVEVNDKQQPSFTITPVLKRAALFEGMPLFQMAGEKAIGAPIEEGKMFATKPAVPDIIKEKFGYTETTIKEKIDSGLKSIKSKEFWDSITTQAVDKLHPIKAKIGDKAYQLHRLLTGSEATFAMLLEHGKLEWINNELLTVGTRDQGFMPFLKKEGKDWKKILYWTAARRAEAIESEDIAAGYTPGDKEWREKWLDAKARKEIFGWAGNRNDRKMLGLSKELKAFNDNILDIAEQSGLIDPEARKVWAQEYYVPFYRIFEDEQAKLELLKAPHKSAKYISAQIQKLRGGGKLGDPLENILHNWMHLLQESTRNVARAEAFNSGVLSNSGLIEEVKFKDLHSFFRKGKNVFIHKRTNEDVLMFQRKGKPVYFKVKDAELFNALSGVNSQQFDNFVMKLMNKTKRVLTYGATFGPAFRVANLLRDTMHTALIDKSFKPFIDSARGLVKAWREDQNYIEFMASGCGFGSSYVRADDPATANEYIQRIMKKEGAGALDRILSTSKKMLDFWEKVGAASENAARVQLYATLKAKGVPPLKAAFKARDLLDFTMSGAAGSVQFLIQTIPFLNARMQGLYKLGRAVADPTNRKNFATRGALLTAASLVLWAISKDDDEYKELEDWDKWSYYHFWIGGVHYRIPKPFEVGALFSSLPTALADILYRNEDTKHIADFLGYTAMETFAIGIPQALKPLAEQWANKSFFTGRPIVGAHLKGLTPGEQKEPWTSETLQLAGKVGISPKRAEALIHGYFSVLGMFLLGGADILTHNVFDFPENPTLRVDDYPLLGRFVREIEPRYTKQQTWFYETLNEMDTFVKTVNHYKKTGEYEKAYELRMEKRNILRFKKRFSKIRVQLRDINKDIKKVLLSKRMSSEQKRGRTDDLSERRNELVKRVYELYREQ